MSVDSFIREWEENTTEGTRPGGRVLSNVESRMARTGWDNTVKVQLGISLAPKQGNGNAFLKAVNQLAKKHNVTLRVTAQNLTPWKQSSMGRGDIVRWLGRNNFRRLFDWPDGFGTEMASK